MTPDVNKDGEIPVDNLLSALGVSDLTETVTLQEFLNLCLENNTGSDGKSSLIDYKTDRFLLRGLPINELVHKLATAENALRRAQQMASAASLKGRGADVSAGGARVQLQSAEKMIDAIWAELCVCVLPGYESESCITPVPAADADSSQVPCMSFVSVAVKSTV